MKKNLSIVLVLILLALCLPLPMFAQQAKDVVVPITVTTSNNPASITLSWPAIPNNTVTVISRKAIFETAFADILLPVNTTTFTDNTLNAGDAYEYRVILESTTAPTRRIGLVYAGIEVPAVAYNRGKVIFVVDDALAAPLATELSRFEQDLRGDGWQVIRRNITAASSTVTSVKTLLRADYEADPANTVAAFLFGNIPVPYSGQIAPDGHGDHVGAWPTDYYYADMDENLWTDLTLNNTAAGRPANDNVPGDGKFDQSVMPSLPELIVSRVDFSNLSGWSVSQTELYRRYLNKNHAFRTGAYKPDTKTLVDDNFFYMGGEAFAQNGWRNGYALTGVNSVVEGDFFNDTENQSFLFGHGCGPGSYTSASGVGNSDNFKTDSINVVFSGLFGSYFGDWDYEVNPFMPSALASKGGILTCSWSGRPNWAFHQMGLGEPIMTSTLFTWINGLLTNPLYPPNFGRSLIHVGLLGDPTLRAHAMKPPANLVATSSCGNISLSWTASPDAALGYLLYRAPALDSVFELLTTNLVADTSYTDSTPLAGDNFYQVKSFRLETTPTGSYYNQSVGTPAQAKLLTLPLQLVATLSDVSCFGGSDGAVSLTVSGGTPPYLFKWSDNSTDQIRSGLPAGAYTVTVSDAANCMQITSIALKQPAALEWSTETTDVKCFGDENGAISLLVQGGTKPYTFLWSSGHTTQNISDLNASAYSATITDARGCQELVDNVVLAEPAIIQGEVQWEALQCHGDETVLFVSNLAGGIGGPYAYQVDNGPLLDPGFPSTVAGGIHSLTFYDGAACDNGTTIDIFEPELLELGTSSSDATCPYASNGSVKVNIFGGTAPYTVKWSNGSDSMTIANLTAGNYTATVTDANGCAQTATGNVNAPAPNNVSIAGSDTACLDQPVIYSLPGIFLNYQWAASNNGSVTQGQGTSNATVLWATPGVNDLTVYFTDINGCPDTASLNLFVDICVGTQEPALEGVQVAPNPFGQHILVQFDRAVQPGAILRLVDTQGRMLAENKALQQWTMLETASLPAGAYFLYLTEQGKTGVWKMMKIE